MKKVDEMEMSINYVASRNAMAFSIIALLVLTIYLMINNQNYSMPLLILSITILTFWCSKYYLTKKMTDIGDDDEE